MRDRPAIRRPVVGRRREYAPQPARVTAARRTSKNETKAVQDFVDAARGIAYAKQRPNWIVVSVREAQRYLDSL